MIEIDWLLQPVRVTVYHRAEQAATQRRLTNKDPLSTPHVLGP